MNSMGSSGAGDEASAGPVVPGVIFDMDGTLADTLEDITCALNTVLRDLGRPQTSVAQVRPMLGIGLRNLVERLFGAVDDRYISELVAHYRPVYMKVMLERTHLYDGVADMLDWLTGHQVPMGVLSNKPHLFTAPICDALLARWPFVQVEGVSSEHRRKPNPVAAIEQADRMGRRCEDVVFVGDSSIDVDTGRNAGMRTIAVTWGYRDRDDLAGADAIIDAPAELGAVLSQWFDCF